MFKVGDIVYKTEERNREARVVNVDFRPGIIIQFSNGDKEKVLEADLMIVQDDRITLSPAQFDEAVKALMYAAAEDVGDNDQLDQVLEIVGVVSAQLKARLFGGND